MAGPLYSIGYVARRTGLSPHVIRAWERRYQAVDPARSGTNRRLYSEADVERLLLLKDASKSHHNIGQMARLNVDDLRKLSSSNRQTFVASTSERERTEKADFPYYLESSIEAIRNLDAAALERILTNAFVELGVSALLTEVISPLMEQVGESWSHGQMRVGEEHLASVVIRNMLGNLSHQQQSELSPKMIVTTPVGQMHEFGALAVAIHASTLGWNAHYLGPNLPAEEISLAIHRKAAKVVSLSLLYKGDEVVLTQELQRLRMLNKDVVIFVGGAASSGYRHILQQISAVLIPDLRHLKEELEKIR